MRVVDTTNPNYKNAGHRVCEGCGQPYFAYQKTRKYCSQACNTYRNSTENLARLKVMATMPRKARKPKMLPNNKVCKNCGAGYRVKPNRVADSNYCSVPCRVAQWRIAPKQCMVCGKDHVRHRKTCSTECSIKWRALHQIGEKSHRWQGGKTSAAMIIRNSQAYADWRKAVFARDNYTCRHCGQRGGELNADHIMPFASHPALRLDVMNGRTLCFECHKKTDTFATGADHSKQKREGGRFSA